MSTTPSYAFQSPSVSTEKGAYRMRPPRTSRPAPVSNSRLSSEPPSSGVHLHVPYRRTRRLVLLVVLLTCAALACFVYAYWLFATRYSHRPPFVRPPSSRSLMPSHVVHVFQPIVSQAHDVPHLPDIAPDALDEHPTRLDMLRADPNITYLSYLPHSGLHNQRIALENALTLARLLNRTLLVPPARLGAKTLRYVRSRTLARMLRLSDKRLGREHCARFPTHIPTPDECVDYMAYTLVPWAWLVDFEPIKAQQELVRASNGTAAWIEERLGIGVNETLVLPDTEPYEYQFVDTSAPAREGDKYLQAIHIDTLAVAPQRLIQLGTLFGSSRLRLRNGENRWVRRDVRRHMVLENAAFTTTTKRIGEALGGIYVGVHVRVGDGRFQDGAGSNARLIWWKLIQDVLGLDTETALGIEKLAKNGDNQDGGGVHEVVGPPVMYPDPASLRVPHPPISPLPDTFFPKRPCRGRLHTAPGLRRLNVPLFIATDAPGGLDSPLLAPLIRTFPCTFVLASLESETAHLEQMRNGYDGLYLAGFLSPIVDALVMGNAWAVVGTEGSTFSRYVEDVLWRVSHGWEIVERG